MIWARFHLVQSLNWVLVFHNIVWIRVLRNIDLDSCGSQYGWICVFRNINWIRIFQSWLLWFSMWN